LNGQAKIVRRMDHTQATLRKIDPVETESGSRSAGMHILHVFPTFDVGGVQLRIAGILSHFGVKYRHTVVALDGRYGCRDRVAPGLHVAFGGYSLPDGSIVGRLRQIRARLRDIAPDLLLTYNWGSIEWALANSLGTSLPHIHLESGFGPEEADRQIARRVWTRRLALRKIRRLVVPSRNLVRIATEVWRLNPDRIVLIPNGVDCARFAAPQRDGADDIIRKRDGELIVGALAPLRPEKNLGRLLAAFAALDADRPCRLLIAGDGPERPMLEARAQALGIDDRVVFAGYVDAPERALALMDVFALSSDTEQMPNALIQAMAAGLPVAGTAVGDVAEIVAEPNRPYVAPAGDDAAFAAALSALVGDPGLRTRLADANVARVREVYSQERMFRAYEDVLDG
jgi:glycosyltransferase involved in cell wall biosynthesis